MGYLLSLHGDLAAAQEHLERSLALAERIGEAILLGESLLKLALTALRRHDTQAVRSLVGRVVAAAEDMASPDGVADAQAYLAWLAWQDRRPQDVIRWAEQIAALNATTAYHVTAGITPHRWIYLWPLMAAYLETGQVAEAVAAGRQLLDPAQQRLPDELESAVVAACRVWDQGEREACGEKLAAALALAHDLRYF